MYDPKVHVGSAALLVRNVDSVTEVLLLQRGPTATHGANTWALPGGWIDWGQTAEEAAAREALEEVNVVVVPEDGELAGVVANTYPEHEMHIVCVAVHFPSYDASGLRNMEPEKCAQLAWTPIGKLAELPLFPPLESLAQQWGWL